MPTPAPDEQLRELGRTIRRMRRERDLTLEALADAAGVHPNQVGRFERGVSDVYSSTLLRIVAGLGVSLTDVARACEARLAERR